jgi:hypothetical protein
MYERHPFEIPLFLPTEDMCWILDKTEKRVKTQATRQGWGYRTNEDGKVFWVVNDLPTMEIINVVDAILRRDERTYGFAKTVYVDFTKMFDRMPWATWVKSGYYAFYLDAAQWCKRLEMLDDILKYLPRFRIEVVHKCVALNTGGDPDKLLWLCRENPITPSIFETSRLLWFPTVFELLWAEYEEQQTEEPRKTQTKRKPSKASKALPLQVETLTPVAQ